MKLPCGDRAPKNRRVDSKNRLENEDHFRSRNERAQAYRFDLEKASWDFYGENGNWPAEARTHQSADPEKNPLDTGGLVN